MKIKPIFPTLIFLIGLTGIFQIAAQTVGVHSKNSSEIKTQNLELYDESRNRSIPVVLYLPEKELSKSKTKKHKIAVLSHGYGNKNSDYSFIAENLAKRGYVVAVIQHDLPTDTPMPTTGDVYQTRKPFWERGARNILFVIDELKIMNWNLNYKKLLLIGHSNGGDISMLFAAEHPNLVSRIISLDNRRMPLPRTSRPRILSIRSSDQSADEGVLPTLDEQKKFHIRIVESDIVHNDMWNGATDKQKREIISIISKFID